MKILRMGIPLFLLLICIMNCHSNQKFLKIPVAEYKEKVYASWLGQIIGNIYGLPHENRHIDDPGPATFPYGYGENLEYLKQNNGAFSDDDTDIEYMYLLAMEKYGPESKYEQLAQSWKYHVRERVWLANRAALAFMHYGFTPPVTGKMQINPHWFQIDPQLVNEIWAVTAPGMINYAARKSGWAARITDDDWGIEPTIFYGALYSAAFFESDIQKLINIGLNFLPTNSRFAQTVKDMIQLYRKYPEDWRKARQEMAQKYYYNEPEDTRTIWNANLNGACAVLALLYGQGNFQKTLDFACAMGFDADNQAATLSGLMGIIVGTEGLPPDLLFPIEGWSKPFNDLYKNVSRYDMPDASLRDMADRMAKQGEKIIILHGGKKITEKGTEYYLVNQNAVFVPPLELPSGPQPYIEIGKELNYQFVVSGGQASYQWKILSGSLPAVLQFKDGRLFGTAGRAGVYPITLQVVSGKEQAVRDFKIVVRTPNLAPKARKVIASVYKTDIETLDAMWLTVPRSLYAEDVNIIRDGKKLGPGSSFYSITPDSSPRIDYYGYEWDSPQEIGLLGFHTGSMEENGGWFNSLNVEYKDENGEWKSVNKLQIYPPLPGGNQPFNKPHFVEYLLAFQPVKTTAIRLIGEAGGTKHWFSKLTHFTSISELTVHGPLPDYQMLIK